MRTSKFAFLLSLVFLHPPAYADDVFNSGINVRTADSNGAPDLGDEKGPITSSPIQKKDGSLNFGLGLGFANIPEDMAVGWDGILGYEWIEKDAWNIGAQLHYLNNSIGKDTDYRSLGLFVTARPENKWFQWLQFKAGLVSDDYSTRPPRVDFQNYLEGQNISWGGTGGAIGVGFVAPELFFQFHILDIERHFVAGHSFNVYTISVLILLDLR
jgi:hypothetical protein